MATSRQLAVACARICDEKKAEGVVVLDARKITTIADYFVICSARSDRQAHAIAQEVRVSMKQKGLRQLGVEGLKGARWILQDLGDVVIHVFHGEARGFYDLEGLWADAAQVRWQKAAPRPKKK